MREAVIGLSGVLIGAAFTAGIAWWTRRDRQRELRRIAARLLLGEASALRRQLNESRMHRRVLPDAVRERGVFLQLGESVPKSYRRYR